MVMSSRWLLYSQCGCTELLGASSEVASTLLVTGVQLLAMIGEQFEESEEICGAVVSVRARQDKIALWTKNAQNEAAQVLGLRWIVCHVMFGQLSG